MVFRTLVILVMLALLTHVVIPPSTAADVAGLPIAESLSPLGGNLLRVWGYDAAAQKWQLYDPASALLSDLTALKRGEGYWFKVDHAQTVTLVKDTYTLSAGWNLVGWLGEAKVYQLQVSRHTTTSLNDAQADTILSASTSVLQTNDGLGDVATFVQWARDGGVTTFTTPTTTPAIINSNADFNEVLAEPGQVKVLNQINWCGEFNNFLGCAYAPGNSIVVIRHAPAIEEGILWAHELGHNKGLKHRVELGAVLYPNIYPNNKKVNQSESDAYQK